MLTTAAGALPVTRRSALALAAAIRAGDVRSRDVVEEHIEVLRRVHPYVRALAAERFAAARAEADAADRRIAAAAPGEGLPPLLGVPCTVKESLALRGMPNTAGLVARRGRVAAGTATAVARIVEAGAIPLGVTNTSELTLWIESENRVYGRTNNAYDPHRTAGGSSGGEGAAVGTGGSPFGIGSDIGGSIRLPAFFNGVFGHKPSQGLVPGTGHYPAADGDAALLLGIGPLARRAEDLMPVLRLMTGPDGRDPMARAVRLGDPDAVAFEGLDVVLSQGASWIPPRRELLDARDRAADALGRRGARVRSEPLRGLRRALELYVVALADGATTTVPELLAEAGASPVTVRRALGMVVRGHGPHTLALLITMAIESLKDLVPQRFTRRAMAAGKALRTEVEGVIGDGVLLHVPHPRVAPPHGQTVGRGWVITPTAAFNLLQLPVTQVPLGLNDDGVPLGVQVVGGRDRDHVTIACALELERAFGGWVPPDRV